METAYKYSANDVIAVSAYRRYACEDDSAGKRAPIVSYSLDDIAQAEADPSGMDGNADEMRAIVAAEDAQWQRGAELSPHVTLRTSDHFTVTSNDYVTAREQELAALGVDSPLVLLPAGYSAMRQAYVLAALADI